MGQTTSRSGDERVEAISQSIRDNQGGVCRAVVEDLLNDPKAREVIEQAAKGIAGDVVRTRTPGLGAFTLTQRVAERAYERARNGDGIGAAADYAAVVAIGATSWIPFGADATIEILRAGGVDLNMSPARTAINTVTGTVLFCQAADVQARMMISPNPSEQDRALFQQLTSRMTPEEMEALGKVAARVAKAHEESKHASGNLPSPQTPRVASAGATVHPRDIH